VTQDYYVGAFFTKDSNDSDGDGIDNHTEIVLLKTNPLIADTDGDGMNDSYEISNGLDPLSSDLVLINLIKTQPVAFNIRLYDQSEVTLAYLSGFNDGNASGFNDGNASGFNDGRVSGFYDGNASGFNDGKASGFNDGKASGLNDGHASALELWSDFNATHVNERNDLYRFIAGRSVPSQTGLGWFYTEQHGWAWLQPSSPGWIYLHNGYQFSNVFDETTVTLNWLNLNPAQQYFDKTKEREPSYPFSIEQFFWLQGQNPLQDAHYPRNPTITDSGNNSNVGAGSQTGSSSVGDPFRN
jgi:hypothetical protein